MASKIRVLSEQTINQIAAGEVIENPASVVKELVENAIDAGASEITVEIRGGGRQLIRVSDDGCGMSQDDALLCLERHATSKIHQLDDLNALSTMGFRGEAVPSIASISKMNIQTRQPDKELGTMVMVDGGKMISCAPAACSPGTTFEIKNLFFNVPVRKKFQKSPTYDIQEIQKVTTLIALAHPQIQFQLISNQEIVLQTQKSTASDPMEQLQERVGSVLGSTYVDDVHKIDKEASPYVLKGFLGSPYVHRPNRTGQYLFINQRPVISSLVSYGVRDGYGMTLPPNRFPLFVLFLTVPGDEVDVNVHPQKKEVRLSHEQKLKEFITRSVENALAQNSFAKIQAEPVMIDIPPSIQPQRSFAPMPPLPSRMTSVQMEMPPVYEKPSAPTPKAIAVIPGYIVTDYSHLSLVDIQAAQARIIFEKLMSQRIATEVQALLIPYTVDVPAAEAGTLRAHLNDLQALGLQVREFGPNTFLVDGVPEFLSGADVPKLIKEIVAELQEHHSSQHMEKALQRKLALKACRHAKLGNDKLSLSSAQVILDRLIACENPFQTPYGTPTMIHLSPEELANRFQ